jgi:hypothetical protein
MSEERERPYRQYSEKPEKQSEKQEKEDEKHEKSWEEKWQRDPLNAAAWAFILIWGGVVLLISNIGIFALFPLVTGWPLFFVGAGAILLLEVVVRLLVPSYRGPVMGTLILSLVFLGIGLGGLINWNFIWAFVLIGIGLSVLVRGLTRRQ